MCEPMTIMAGMSAVGAAGAANGQRAAAKQAGMAIAQQNAQKQEIIREMNYAAVAGQQDAINVRDEAVQQMTELNINAIRNQGMVEAAFGESGVEGRSQNAVLREVQGTQSRQVDAIRQGVTEKERAIQYNIETGQLSAIGQIKGMGKITGPDSTTQFLGILGGAASGAASGLQLASGLQSAGILKASTGANTGTTAAVAKTGANTR